MYIIYISILLFILLFITIYYYSNTKENFDYAFKNEWIEYVDIIYYINLDHRTDRDREMLKEFEKMNIPKEKIKRISGTYNKEHGHLGCSSSHIKTVEEFVNSNYKNCIIFEDDFEFVQSPETVSNLFLSFFKENINYDVLLLSANGESEPIKDYPFIQKVINSQTTSGYMINKNFAPILLQNYKEGYALFEKAYNSNQNKESLYAIDQYWKILQNVYNWFVFEPKIGKQRKSKSDISGIVVDYGV